MNAIYQSKIIVLIRVKVVPLCVSMQFAEYVTSILHLLDKGVLKLDKVIQ